MKTTLLLPLVVAIFTVTALTNKSLGKLEPQSVEWDFIRPEQQGLLLGGSREGIAFKKDGAILWGDKVIGQCPHSSDYPDGVKVYISPTSPKKELFVVLCWEDGRGGKDARIIDGKNRTVLAKNVVPNDWGIASWVSWSPNEDFAPFHAVGEVTMGDIVFVNLASGKAQEIHYKNFTNNLRDTQDRVQGFDRNAMVWLNPTSFRLKLDVRCNRYDGDTCDYEKVLSSHPARVNLNPFSISYGNTDQARSSGMRQRTSERSSQTSKGIRSIDFRNFTYPLDGDARVSVSNGEWEDKNPEWYGGVYHLKVNQILFGDLTGDGQEDAFIIATGASNYGATGWNSLIEKYYVYTMKNGKPEPLSVFSSSDLDELYSPHAKNDRCDGRVMDSKAIGIKSMIISLKIGIAGPVCIGPNVLMNLRLDNNKLVLVGKPIKQRKRSP